MLETSDILDDNLSTPENEIKFELAEQGDRALNCIIDGVFQFVLLFCAAIGVFIFFPNSKISEFLLQDSRLVDYGLGAIVTLGYYFIFELLTQGKTLGKYFTKTRSVKEDRTPLDFSSALIRTFCRIIPFDAFSYLGKNKSGWHDRFSDTVVIKDAGWKSWKNKI